MGVPFADADEAEICARVIFRWAERLYRSHPSTLHTLNKVTSHQMRLCEYLTPSHIFMSCLYSLAVETEGKGAAKRWRDRVVMCDRAGLLWRRSLFEGYKANRRDPRVTNRGVGLADDVRAEASYEPQGTTNDTQSAEDNTSAMRSGLDDGNAAKKRPTRRRMGKIGASVSGGDSK